MICPVANKKIRHYPVPMGLGSYSESIDVRQSDDLKLLANKVELYMRRIEYTGNFSAEFLFYKGKYYFMEVNLRNDGTSWLSTCSGFNLPDFVCRSFEEIDVCADNNVFKKKYFMNIMADLHHLRNGSVKLVDWIKQFNGQTCYSHFNKNDRRPFVRYLQTLIKQCLTLF